MKNTVKLWIGIGVLILLSPLGLLLPEYFKAGAAWGEWDTETIKGFVGYIPKGLEKLSGIWSAPIPDYAFRGWEGRGPAGLSLAYIASAIIGVVATVCVVIFIGKLLAKKD